MSAKLLKTAYPHQRRPALVPSSSRPRTLPDGPNAGSPRGSLGSSASDGPQQGRHFPADVQSSALFRRHASHVAAIATRLLGRDAEVDDVVQDVFLIAFRGLGALRHPAATKAWLAKIAVRVSMRRLRWRRVRRLLGLEAHGGYEDLPDPSLSPERQLVVSRIYALLDRLPVADRVAWTLRRVDDNPAEVVAALCSCSLATAKRRIARVDEAVRQELGHA